jgi:2-oxoisovalerate dehydrogenase E1 component
MAIIRAFETMLQEVKTQRAYRRSPTTTAGRPPFDRAGGVGGRPGVPAGVDDHIFGSHRSHGEILAKGLSAIEKLDDDTLLGS